jgi:hypothetical protein
MSVLDVGCGLHPRGDVNVDLYITSEHRRNGYGPHIDVENTPSFIQADALDMHMFKDRQFNTVRCYHLMEHLPHPKCWDLLRELWRVTDKWLVVEVPHRRWLRPLRLKRPFQHVSNFDYQTLERGVPIAIGTRNFEITRKYRGMFHPLIPFPYWPHHLRLDVWRGD